ncbi:MAG: hypothetical protein CL938_03600 [Deltaproteobacteria bacterium]|jgi:hypothetical protein|nr:hypothetical protein [Deltaproteobacteria bacterium]MDP7300934.1 hypothetical protein [Myxococcota bacterium]
MPDRAWKAFERRVAQAVGGRRRGADTGGCDGGRSDVIAPGLSVECKLLRRPGFAGVVEACRQAEAAAGDLELPVAVVKRFGARDADALVALRLEVFREWFVGGRHIEP